MSVIKKGQRVRLGVDRVRLPGESWSLAGMQMKVLIDQYTIEGVVTHIRGDRPVDPVEIGLWIRKDDGAEVVVNTKSIVTAEVLE